MRIKHLFTFTIPAISIAATIPSISTAHGGIEPRSPIIGGVPVDPRYPGPYVVALIRPSRRYPGDEPFCGGTLIGPKVVLTARHCVENLRNPIAVYAGATNINGGGFRVGVHKIVFSPIHDWDAAILILAQELRAGFYRGGIHIGYAILPRFGHRVRRGSTVFLVGWGIIDTTGTTMDLQVTQQTVDECSREMWEWLGPQHACSSGPGTSAWYGDSGGPVFQDSNRLVGVISSGHPHYPVLAFIQVGFLMNWIEEVSLQEQVGLGSR